MADETPEQMMARYLAGDRHPRLLRRLDELAWEAFHDPWETRSALRARPVGKGRGRLPVDPSDLEETNTPEVTPMPEDPESSDPILGLEPLGPGMIARHLDEMELSYWRMGPAHFLVNFAYDSELDRCVKVRLATDGTDGDILMIRVEDDRRIPRERFPEAMQLCNRWNADCRWPRAWLDIPDPEPDAEEAPEPASGNLVLDFQVPLRGPLPPGLVDGIIQAVISANGDFWKRAREGHGF